MNQQSENGDDDKIDGGSWEDDFLALEALDFFGQPVQNQDAASMGGSRLPSSLDANGLLLLPDRSGNHPEDPPSQHAWLQRRIEAQENNSSMDIPLHASITAQSSTLPCFPAHAIKPNANDLVGGRKDHPLGHEVSVNASRVLTHSKAVVDGFPDFKVHCSASLTTAFSRSQPLDQFSQLHQQHFESSLQSFDPLQHHIVNAGYGAAASLDQSMPYAFAASSVHASGPHEEVLMPSHLHLQGQLGGTHSLNDYKPTFDSARLFHSQPSVQQCNASLPISLPHQMHPFDVTGHFDIQNRSRSDVMSDTKPRSTSAPPGMQGPNYNLNSNFSTSLKSAADGLGFPSEASTVYSFSSKMLSSQIALEKDKLKKSAPPAAADVGAAKTTRKRRRYRHESFPVKLHRLLKETKQAGQSSIISWTSSGNAFRVHDPKAFAKDIAPKFFRTNHYHSFQRNLSMYGFDRIFSGPDIGAYSHPLFLRDEHHLCDDICRVSQATDDPKEESTTTKKTRSNELKSENKLPPT